MRLDTSQQMRLQQKLILAPRMIQSMEILQLPIMELQERIQQELQENPVLEIKEETPEETAAATEGGEERANPDEPSDLERELVVKDDANNELDFDRLEAISQDWEDHFNEEHRPSRNGLDAEADKKHDAMQNMASRPQSLHDFLFDQVCYLDAPARMTKLVRFLISALDDNGYLTSPYKTGGSGNPLEDVIRTYDEPVTLEEAEEALRLLQKLEPPGVGCRDLRECLLLQLTDETPHREVLRTLISNHLDDIRHNRLPVIQRKTGFDLATIKEGIEALKHLNPRPGAAFSNDHIPYVVPDIVVERAENGEYTVRLLDDYVPNIYISRRYVEMLRDKGSDPKAREYLKRKIQSAQWLMDSIEQRRSTLEKVTRAIIRHQHAFLERGPEYIEPLKMQQVADQVGVHVTTVSRAVDDKWVQTPRGIFPLKRFFGGGTTTAEGEEVAWEIIKQKLLDIIAHEDKANPYSDEDLVSKLQEAGFPVARRTVTKYRKLLKIPSSRQRKDWTVAAAEANGKTAHPEHAHPEHSDGVHGAAPPSSVPAHPATG
jgi:RNA polymerase sigma-54 factor